MDVAGWRPNLSEVSHTILIERFLCYPIYLSGITDEHGGSDTDVKTRNGKARAAYLQLKNTWNSKQLSTNTKVGILNTNVKTVLLYEAETWRTTKATIQKIQMLTLAYAKYFGSAGQRLSATNAPWDRTNQVPVEEEALE
ncbi:unnamed protein product, partial [Schistosoma margrebowiei]